MHVHVSGREFVTNHVRSPWISDYLILRTHVIHDAPGPSSLLYSRIPSIIEQMGLQYLANL